MGAPPLTHLAKHEKVKSFSPSPGVIDHPDVALVVAAATVVEKSHQSSAPTSGTLRLPPDVALKKVTALQELTAEAKIEITLLRRRRIGKLGSISRGLATSGFLGGYSDGCTCSGCVGAAPMYLIAWLQVWAPPGKTEGGRHFQEGHL